MKVEVSHVAVESPEALDDLTAQLSRTFGMPDPMLTLERLAPDRLWIRSHVYARECWALNLSWFIRTLAAWQSKHVALPFWLVWIEELPPEPGTGCPVWLTRSLCFRDGVAYSPGRRFADGVSASTWSPE